MTKILILYAYHNAKSNLDYFLKYGIKPYSTDQSITLLIIHNEDEAAKPITHPTFTNYIYLRTFHMGKAWKSWHRALNLIDYHQFTHFIFLKDTVKGPLPISHTGKHPWYTKMLKLLTKNTKMIGLEYMIKPTSIGGSWKKHGLAIPIDQSNSFNAHVSTPIWCTDLEGLKVILPMMLDSLPNYPKREFVIEKGLVDAGYKLGSLEPRFRWFQLGNKEQSDSLTEKDSERMYRLHFEVDPNLSFQWTKKRHKFIYKTPDKPQNKEKEQKNQLKESDLNLVENNENT